MQQTSLTAYFTKALPKMSGRQSEIYGLIKQQGPINNREIALITRIPINAIPAPVLKLRKSNMIELAYKRVDPITNTTAMYWRASVKEWGE